jgi:topoisomerase-4 subunit A
VGVKSRKAKGKRLTTYDVDTLTFIEPEEPETLEDQAEEPMIDEPMIEGEEMEEETPVMMSEDEEYKTEQLNLF